MRGDLGGDARLRQPVLGADQVAAAAPRPRRSSASSSSATEFVANLSIPTLDEKAWRATEPHTPHPRKRIEAVAELNRNGIPTGVLIAPLIPGVNDDPKQVEELLGLLGEAGAQSVGGDRPAPARRGARDLVRLAAPVPARPGRALRGALRARRLPATDERRAAATAHPAGRARPRPIASPAQADAEREQARSRSEPAPAVRSRSALLSESATATVASAQPAASTNAAE